LGSIHSEDIYIVRLGSIAGKVSSLYGSGSAGVKKSTTPATEEVFTDADGNYSFLDLESGSYTLHLFAEELIKRI